MIFYQLLFFSSITDGYQEADIAYAWKEDQPIQVHDGYPKFLVPKWAGHTLRKPTVGRCDVVTSTGKYSCIRLQMVFVQN